MKEEQKQHFSQWEENKQKRNRGKQQIKPVRTTRSDENMGAKGWWKGQGLQRTLTPSCCFVLSSGGARRKKHNDSGIIYHQRPFPHSLFLAENHRLITENDFSWKRSFWHQQPSNPRLQLAGYVHLPPEAHTPFHIMLVISGDSTWSGVQLFASYTLKDESLKLYLTKLNVIFFLKVTRRKKPT